MQTDNSIQRIINRSSDPKLIEGVFEFAKEAYKERTRPSGENYIVHAVKVAATLDKMDSVAIPSSSQPK